MTFVHALLIGSVSFLLSWTVPPPAEAQRTKAIPELAQWRTNMLVYGRQHCNREIISKLGRYEGSVWYYDGIRVYYQIAAYLKDQSWYRCAKYVRDVYGDYVIDANGAVGGWQVFPDGLFLDFRRTGSYSSLRALRLLATNSPFAGSGGGSSFELSRETAYLINAYLRAAEARSSQPEPLAKAVNFALDHLRQWSGTRTAPYIKPFMMGLTFEALIKYHARTHDRRVPRAVKRAARYLWRNHWAAGSRAFPYIICRTPDASPECGSADSGPAPDLNLLIAPAYAWLYSRTGEVEFRRAGDEIFAGGVTGAWLGGGKQFSQNYRWSFDYVKWRKRR